MRWLFLLLAIALLCAFAVTALARVDSQERLMMTAAPRLGQATDDVPAGALPARAPDRFARADTFNFGYYDYIGGNYYAHNYGTGYDPTMNNSWTWDHGAPNPLEGWFSVDNTASVLPSKFRQITAANWSGHGNLVPAPIIHGVGSVWVGVFEDSARVLCWTTGLGYGNSWCMQLRSPTYTYTGSGWVTLSFNYFNDTEIHYDYTKVKVRRQNGQFVVINPPGFTGKLGDPSTELYPTYSANITGTQIGGAAFNLAFEFLSDAGYSDEDGFYPTTYGPFGCDDVTVGGSVTGGPFAYSFETDLEGWTLSPCPSIGSYFGIHDVGDYLIQDPCACRLQGNVAELHNADGQHPEGQFESIYSPPADRGSLGPSYNMIFCDWDIYGEMPAANGVLAHPAWRYYPVICPTTGESVWSGRVGQIPWFYMGDDPACTRQRNVATDHGVPPDCQYVEFIFEIINSCDIFGIPSTVCTHSTNATPLLDNVQIRVTGVPNAATIVFDPGTYYQDGFGQGLIATTTNTGNANITEDLHMDIGPDLLGDSLMVRGPMPTVSTKWETRLWFRLKRIGPAQSSITGYSAWYNRVRKGFNIVGPDADFTYGWMDSVQVGTAVYRDQFDSYFRENDPSYNPGPPPNGDRARQNGILLDGILAPGTKVEWFVTSNYTCTPGTCYYLPDTTGGWYVDLEILPSYRRVDGVDKFPCVLLVSGGRTFYTENALNVVLNDAPPYTPIPDPTSWDRYDYFDTGSNWDAPLARGVGGNAGATLPELLCYRLILVLTGDGSRTNMDPRDWAMFGDWMSATACGNNGVRQGFIANGNNIADLINWQFPSFLNSYLGATWTCGTYSDAGCGPVPADENYCVKLVGVGGGAWQPAIPLDVYGNWCPPKYAFDRLATVNGGVGNKAYQVEGGSQITNYAQVTRSETSPGNYRTVLDGYSFGTMTKRDPGVQPPLIAPCPNDSAHIVEGTYVEIRDAIRWTLSIADPTQLGLCINPCTEVGVEPDGHAPGGLVNDLQGNYPNPFNPRTEIRFSLARSGPVSLMVYDVGGRKVKTVLNSRVLQAGPNSTWWDGTDDAGRRVSAGVYWSRLAAGDYRSNKKMVVLK